MSQRYDQQCNNGKETPGHGRRGGGCQEALVCGGFRVIEDLIWEELGSERQSTISGSGNRDGSTETKKYWFHSLVLYVRSGKHS